MAKKKKFLRAVHGNYSKLGRRRKKLQKYRKAKGTDNKMRLKIKGHPRNISIGFRSEKSKRDLINDLKPIRVFNIKDLTNLKEKEIGVIGKVGNKKRVEIVNYAVEKKIKLANINPKKFLEEIKKKQEEIKKLKEEKEKKKELKDKKAKKEAEKKAKKEAKEERKEDKGVKEEAVKQETEIKENVEEKK